MWRPWVVRRLLVRDWVCYLLLYVHTVHVSVPLQRLRCLTCFCSSACVSAPRGALGALPNLPCGDRPAFGRVIKRSDEHAHCGRRLFASARPPCLRLSLTLLCLPRALFAYALLSTDAVCVLFWFEA